MGYEMEQSRDIALSESDYDRLVTHNQEQGEYIKELLLVIEMLKADNIELELKCKSLQIQLENKRLD